MNQTEKEVREIFAKMESEGKTLSEDEKRQILLLCDKSYSITFYLDARLEELLQRMSKQDLASLFTLEIYGSVLDNYTLLMSSRYLTQEEEDTLRQFRDDTISVYEKMKKDTCEVS